MDFVRKYSNSVVIAIILFFITISVYKRGLFFDKDFYLLEIVISLLFLAYIFLHKKNLLDIFKQPYIWLLLGIDLLYLIQTFFASNQLLAFQQFFRWVFVTQLFILVLFIKNKKWIDNLIWYSIILAGVWTSIFGWLAVYNLTDFSDAYWTNRISSVFQYPNTFGAFISAILIGILIRSTSSKWYYSISSIASYLLTLTIVFTYSRGTWLVLPIVWLIALFFLSFRRQLLYILHTLLIGIALLLTLSSINNTIVNNDYGKGFLIIAVVSITIAVIYFLINIFFNKITISKSSNITRWIIPILAIIVFASSLYTISNPKIIDKLPESLGQRIEDINLETKSVQERGLFYKDSPSLIKERPILGHGGGAWRELYKSYQSYPYNSSQAHNFYLQLTIEIGLLGLILFISFIFLILLSIIKNRNNLDADNINRILAYGFMVFLILFHSFIDFNMSYLYILGLAMLLLAMIVVPIDYPIHRKDSKQKLFTYISIILIILMSVVGLVYTSKFLYADKLTKGINDLSVTEMDERLDKMISLNPYELEYRFLKMDFYQQLYDKTKGDEYKQDIIEEAVYIRDLNSKDPVVILRLSQSLAKNGYIKDSVNILEEGINNAPWQKELYEQYFIYGLKLAEYYQVNGDQQHSKELLSNIINYYDDILNKREFLDKQIPSLQYKGFGTTQNMNLYVGQIYIINKEYDKGLELLIPLTKNKDQKIKDNAIVWTVFAYEEQKMQKEATSYSQLGQEYVSLKIDEIKSIWR